jgi:hypothetical protein
MASIRRRISPRSNGGIGPEREVPLHRLLISRRRSRPSAQFSRDLGNELAQRLALVMGAHRQQQDNWNWHTQHPQQNSSAHDHLLGPRSALPSPQPLYVIFENPDTVVDLHNGQSN